MSELLGITGAIGSGKTTFVRYLGNATEDHAIYETWEVIADVATEFNGALQAELEFETTSGAIDLANQVLIWLPDAISEHLHHDVVWNQLAISVHDVNAHPELYQKLFDYIESAKKDSHILGMAITETNKETYRPILQWLGGYLVAKISKTIWYDELLRRIQLRDPTTSLVIINGVRYASDALTVRNAGGKILRITRQAERASSDVTDAELGLIEPDVTIQNNGTLQQLQTLATNVTNDLDAGNLQKTYEATTL
ncbi:MAG TPA: hypothetical protein VLG40_00410 [Candidatus Saccharimonas sp.]|nr:hypothetical protein [Candidatus Saccharimonas sp.]